MNSMLKQCQQAIRLLLIYTLLTGLIYPLFLTGVGAIVFPWRANGSIMNNGSEWIGQYFTADDYFWGRPSATEPFPYDGLGSKGSNSAISHPIYFSLLQNRVDRYKPNHKPIPIELVSASGSGLDPDISPEGAIYQAQRVAEARHISLSRVMSIIQNHIIPRTWGILGEPRINVLALNKALDAEGK